MTRSLPTPEAPTLQRIAALEHCLGELEAFGYMVVHELRAPLQVIAGFARNIEEDPANHLTDSSRARLRRVVDSTLKMECLIDHLMMLMLAPHIRVEKHPVAVDEIVREVVGELRGAYPLARVLVSELPRVMGDATIVRQVFRNLVANAFKFSRLAAQPVVEIAIDAQGAFIVRDNGIGFEPQEALAIFQPFTRMTSNAAYPGSGVGLAIVQRLLTRHGGWITAASQAGGPTELRFSFGED